MLWGVLGARLMVMSRYDMSDMVACVVDWVLMAMRPLKSV